jgi:hypothetical protein
VTRSISFACAKFIQALTTEFDLHFSKCFSGNKSAPNFGEFIDNPGQWFNYGHSEPSTHQRSMIDEW